jgi:uncharacterized protein YukE
MSIKINLLYWIRDNVADIELTDAAIDVIIDEAIAICGADFPIKKIDVVTLPNLPASWTYGSRVISAFYPASTDRPMQRPISVYAMGEGANTRLLSDTYPAGTECDLYYYTPATESDFSLSQQRALQTKAASMACRMMSVKYASDQNSNVGAGAIEFQSRSDTWAARARELESVYEMLKKSILKNSGEEILGSSVRQFGIYRV